MAIRPVEFEAWLRIGFLSRRLGDLAAAREALWKAVRLAETHVPANVFLAEVCRELGDRIIARQAAERALSEARGEELRAELAAIIAWCDHQE